MALEKERQIFEDYSIPKAVATLAIPTVLTQIITFVYNLVDTWFVGLTNNSAMIAALSVCMPLYILMAAIANLFGIGATSVISRSLGEKKIEKARNAFSFALYGGIIASIIYALIILIFKDKLTYLVGGTIESYAHIQKYMFWTMIIGACPTILNSLFGHLIRSIGDSKTASFGMGLGSIVNIILDPIFMFILLPSGNEVEAAAIATLIANCVATIYFIIYIHKHNDNPVFTLSYQYACKDSKVIKELLTIGFPAALNTTLAMVSNIFANALVSGYGSIAVAGMGIAKKINTLAFNVTMGLTQGVLPLIGYNFAAKNHERMKKTISFMLTVALIFTISCAFVFISNDDLLVSFFIKDIDTINEGTQFLKVIALGVPLAAITYSMNAIFQALGEKKKAFILSILRKGCLDIPLMYLFMDKVGKLGIVLATPIAEIISASLALILLLTTFKKLKKGMD